MADEREELRQQAAGTGKLGAAERIGAALTGRVPGMAAMVVLVGWLAWVGFEFGRHAVSALRDIELAWMATLAGVCGGGG
jgi:hypothetical protein